MRFLNWPKAESGKWSVQCLALHLLTAWTFRYSRFGMEVQMLFTTRLFQCVTTNPYQIENKTLIQSYRRCWGLNINWWYLLSILFQQDSELNLIWAKDKSNAKEFLSQCCVVPVLFNQFVTGRVKVAKRIQGQTGYQYWCGGWVERESGITGTAYFDEKYKGNDNGKWINHNG